MSEHECAYDTPGAGPCETCLDLARLANIAALVAKFRADLRGEA